MVPCKKLVAALAVLAFVQFISFASAEKPLKVLDAKSIPTGLPVPEDDPELIQYGIYAATAPRAKATQPRSTTLPLALKPNSRVALIGNALVEQSQHFGYLETLLQQKYPQHSLVVRNLGWPADTVDLQPRPDNFADTAQHLHHERADVVIAAFGFNESFAGPDGLDVFRKSLQEQLRPLTSSAFNGVIGPEVVLLSPIANENVTGVSAANANNENIAMYVDAMRDVASEMHVGFIDLFQPTLEAMRSPGSDLTINGVHLNDEGYKLFAKIVYKSLFGEVAPDARNDIRQVVIDKNRQFFRRFRPLNTYYYTGGRSQEYGYLDFLPAMRNFDIMVANRDQRIWDLAQGKTGLGKIDDSNLPFMPDTKQSRGANEWLTAADELKAFQVDPRFEVNLFAGEEEFPDIAAPIQMRWDNRGRLWVSCSTTYPHVYPGKEPDDRLVILEDTDGDGKADKSTVFADDLHIPLSFEFGDGGVYVSEEPHLTFLKDTDGDGKADLRQVLLTGFGTEDSHHSLHDFVWTPDGDLIFRESIFHHSQVETPYGPVRQQNSGWFRFEPQSQRLTSFGSYPSTNPWGVVFDDWGQHVASHPIFAAAFHSLDPPYPNQHPKPDGLNAYSGTCGQEFVDFATFPDELQGGYIKARYKPTNRIEIHKWNEGEFGFDEEYVSDLIFSTNLSFIPVDIRFGPRGDLYICDWYNPVKGHAQYSLRDERRDRHSGRIWRVTEKGKPLQDPPKIADASIDELLDQLQRPESRIRYWIRSELRERPSEQVKESLDKWVKNLSPSDPRFRHHQVEAMWVYRGIDTVNSELLRELLQCDERHARAAATQQLRYWHSQLPDSAELLRRAAGDAYAMVRMEAAIAATYIGTREAFDALLEVLNHPLGGHLDYAVHCALGSYTMRPYWENDKSSSIAQLMLATKQQSQLKEPTPSAPEAQFDNQKGLAKFEIGCLPEVMKFTQTQIAVTPGQPVKIVFTNPDATDHNLVFVKPGALEEVGMAANEMARDPKNANSDFIPKSKRSLILHASKMIGPTRKSRVEVLRFSAPTELGIYPFVCTFPGHWIIMNGVMVVANDLSEVDQLLAESKPKVIKNWTLEDFTDLTIAPESEAPESEARVMRGMTAFVKANCSQCHVLAGHGVNLGPDLKDVTKRYQGIKLLGQLIDPSSEIHEKYQTHNFLLADGSAVSGVISKEDRKFVYVITNLLTPDNVTKVPKADIEEQLKSKVSAMPAGLLDVLTKEEIGDLLTFLQAKNQDMHGHGDHGHK